MGVYPRDTGQPSSSNPAKRGRRKAGERASRSTRELILHEAARLFFARGFTDVSVDDICRKLKITKGGFYYNFVSKETLLFIFNEMYLQRGLTLLNTLKTEDRSSFEKFSDLFNLSAQTLSEWQHFVAVANQEHRHLKGALRKRIEAMRDEYQSYVEALIIDGQRRGEIIPTLDSKIIVFNYFGMVNWIYRWYDKRGRLSASDVMTLSRVQFLRGISSGYEDSAYVSDLRDLQNGSQIRSRKHAVENRLPAT